MSAVTLYGKPDCHLCEDARERIVALRESGLEFELLEVDIGGDEDLHRRFLERIPVVAVDGEIVSELVFEPSSLLAKLDSVGVHERGRVRRDEPEAVR